MEQPEAFLMALDQVCDERYHKHDVLGREAHSLGGNCATQTLQEGGYQLGWEHRRAKREVQESQEPALLLHVEYRLHLYLAILREDLRFDHVIELLVIVGVIKVMFLEQYKYRSQ